MIGVTQGIDAIDGFSDRKAGRLQRERHHLTHGGGIIDCEYG